jgi:hypothetical protein
MTHHLAAQDSPDRQADRQTPPHRRPGPPARRRRFRTLVVLVLVAGAVAIGASAKVRRTGTAVPDAAVSGSLVPASGLWLGVQVAPGSTGSAQRTLRKLESRVGRRVEVVYQQLRWDEPLERVSALAASRHARTPLLGWKPLRSNGSIVPWPSIASGREDARLKAMATRLKALPKRVFLTFAHQPEPQVASGYGTAGDYVLAYRHVHDVFAKLGVTNVVWVWSMTSAPKWASLHTQLYPGDGYVDWLAFDVGDATCGPRSSSRSLADLTRPFHDWVATRHPGKPVMATGYGQARHPAAAPAPERLAADLSTLTTQRPEIQALVFAGAEPTGGCGKGGATTSMPATSMPATPVSPTGPAGRSGTASTAASAAACLSRGGARVTRVGGTLHTYRVQSVPDQRTYDLRRATIVGYPAARHYPVLFGKYGPGDATCVVGGEIRGRQSRALSWHTMKQQLDGDGLNFRSQGGIVDGIRIDNVEDGIATTGGDPVGVTIRNAYLSYIRDDCIENDAIVNLTVHDSLLDGCFNGVSERRGGSPPPPPPGEALTLDGVLIRLRPMPYDRTRAQCQGNAADGLGSSGFFKWSGHAHRPVVRHTVLLAERGSVNCGASMRLPHGLYEDVTLVWLGRGDYPGGPVPRGVTVTRDRRVWDEARESWLARHGYPVTGDVGAP